jgi:atypical dual specificity phosphatase
MRRDLIRPLSVPEALAATASSVLLDEPTVGASESERRELPALIRRRALTGGVVLVTHDLAFAREVADDIALLVAGRLDVAASSQAFFEHPPTPMADQFLRRGTCWPPPVPPSLPSHFRWILPEQLAGLGRPGLLSDVEADLTALATAGIGLLVSLTEDAFPVEQLRSFGLAGRHFPIRDMDVPALGPTARLCAEIERTIAAGQRVAVHCRAGLGRTGLILASYLVWMGRSPDEAVAEVRSKGRGFIQTKAQVDFVTRFAESVPPTPAKKTV